MYRPPVVSAAMGGAVAYGIQYFFSIINSALGVASSIGSTDNGSVFVQEKQWGLLSNDTKRSIARRFLGVGLIASELDKLIGKPYREFVASVCANPLYSPLIPGSSASISSAELADFGQAVKTVAVGENQAFLEYIKNKKALEESFAQFLPQGSKFDSIFNRSEFEKIFFPNKSSSDIVNYESLYFPISDVTVLGVTDKSISSVLDDGTSYFQVRIETSLGETLKFTHKFISLSTGLRTVSTVDLGNSSIFSSFRDNKPCPFFYSFDFDKLTHENPLYLIRGVNRNEVVPKTFIVGKYTHTNYPDYIYNARSVSELDSYGQDVYDGAGDKIYSDGFSVLNQTLEQVLDRLDNIDDVIGNGITVKLPADSADGTHVKQKEVVGTDISTEASDAANDKTNTETDTSKPKPSRLPNVRVPASIFMKKFPFCIPWDFYNLFSIFDASPVPPKFVFPITIARLGINESIVIDFSSFESVAGICRFFSGAFFILGLILITRKMIGAQ